MNALPHAQLDPELQTTVNYCDESVQMVLAAAGDIHHDQSDAQIHAFALYGTIVELFSACLGLARLGEPTAIPAILRSMYEAHVDLDNLVADAGYVEHIIAAGLDQTIKIMEAQSLHALKDDRKADYDELRAKLADLNCRGRGPLKIWKRCQRVGRLEEYNSLYALFCMDTHNNGAALAERHLSENAEGNVMISFFGPYDPWAIIRRLDLGVQFLLNSARYIHGAFRVPAPQIEELATRLDQLKAQRAQRHAPAP